MLCGMRYAASLVRHTPPIDTICFALWLGSSIKVVATAAAA
jgi:hypothetical protein